MLIIQRNFRVVFFNILTIMFMVLTGCSSEKPCFFSNDSKKIKVLSTTEILGSVIREIGGERIDHLTLITGELDPHSYQLVKGDDEKLMSADLIFHNGLSLEHGASLRKYLRCEKKAISVGDRLYKKCPERFIMIGEVVDPHFWMDMRLFAESIDDIVDVLSNLQVEDRNFFIKKGANLKNQLYQKDQEFVDRMRGIDSSKRYLVSSHDAFFYFSRRYLAAGLDGNWADRVVAPEGLAPDSQMSLSDIKNVWEFICDHSVSVIFAESNINSDSLKKVIEVCCDQGHSVRLSSQSLYSDTLGKSASDSDQKMMSYIEMMEHNINTMIKEWQ